MERTLVFAGLAALSLLSGIAAFASEGGARTPPVAHVPVTPPARG